MNAPARIFEAKPAVRGEEPLLIGMVGPPGGGKTYSALRLAKGMQSVRGGDIVLIDTEGGRAKKYADEFRFLHVGFEPPHQPHAFLEAIEQQLPRKPACIIVDSASDEHEGKGGYLEWHDEMVPKMGGNEWAAWAKPKASRKRFITGLLHVTVPLIFTFRAREKTKQNPDARNSKDKIVNIGWMPVAPLEIVHTLDLTCILPPRADGVPVWESSKIGEDFIIKLPKFLAPMINQGAALDEATGRALAEWAKGGAIPQKTSASDAEPPRFTVEEYIALWDGILDAAQNAKQLGETWNSDHHKTTRRRIFDPSASELAELKGKVTAKITSLQEAETSV